MHRCLVSPGALDEETCQLGQAASHHLRTVLRAKVGEPVQLLDGGGRRRMVRVASIDRNAVRCEACGSVETLPRVVPAITVYQCVAKGARMDWLVEKAVELGAAALVPVMSRNCVVKHAEGERVVRWERTADSALEQCGGVWRLRIEPVQSWKAAVERVRAEPPALVAALTPDARTLTEALARWRDAPPATAAWIVGPEGDFTGEELLQLRQAGAEPVSLGARVLRTETAAIFGICALSLSGMRPPPAEA